jgi:hypothetical protein
MNRLNIKKKIIVIFVISFILFLSVIILIVLRKIDSKDFHGTASDIDYDISSGFFSQAEKQIPELYTKIINKNTALSFLKRSERLSSATGSYSDFVKYSSELSKRYRNNLELTAVHAYAEYKNGNYDEALSSSRQKLGRSEYSSIYLVSSIKSNKEIEDKKIFEHIPDEYKMFFKDKLPDADELIAASRIIRDDRLLIDSALIFMKDGDKQKGFDILNSMKDADNELGMFISYDNEDYQAAAGYFADLNAEETLSNEIMLFGADIMLKVGNPDEAVDIYNEIINVSQDFSWIPYRNLYSLEYDSDKSIENLESGLKQFPGQEELLLPLAWENYLNNGRTDDSRFVNLLNPEINGALPELFRINVLLINRSQEHIIGNYWNIVNRAPDSQIIAVSFANYLLRNRSFDQLQILLERYREYNGEADWIFMYEAVSACMQGNITDALMSINKVSENNKNIEVLYNNGVINTLSGDSSEAIVKLEKAAFLAETEERENNLVKIYFKLAENYYNNFEMDKADFYIKRSLRIKPDDIRSSLLLKKIEEGING